MKRWKWILASTALLVAISGGAMAEEQHWRGRHDDDAYSQRYERRRDNNGYYRGNNGYYGGNYAYRDRDGDRDDRGYWRQRRDRDHDRSYNRHDRDDHRRDRDRD